MTLSPDEVRSRLVRLRAMYRFEDVVALRLRELRGLLELTRHLQSGRLR